MTTAVFRFRDEWLVRLIQSKTGVPAERIEQWRSEKKPFLSQQLIDDGLLTFEQIAELIHGAYRIGSTELGEKVADEVAQLVPEKVVRRHFVLPIRADQREVHLAMANPLDEVATQDVRSVTGRKVNPLFCEPAMLERATLEDLHPDAVVYNLLKKFQDYTPVEVVERESDEPDEEVTAGPRAPVVQLADNIISNAVRLNASDIHIEHDETTTLVRYRMDGLLKNMLVLPRYVGAGPLVSRIKIMAGLDVSDRLRPQDGRAKLRVGQELIGLRVSTLPARTGEKVVLRILNERAIQAKLEQLGFQPDVLRHFSAMLAREQGVVLVTGPTGSGKTTTLYAALSHLRGETVNVVTVEDPIEYRLSGITQVQVNEKQGLTFATVLRSVLRQDPDVVMLGEIRDHETALVAVQAALTGHLVLSTLHTNDTVGAVTRLADMGVEKFKISSALAGVTAQRLVRRVCPACAQPAPPEELPPEIRAIMQRLYGKVAHVAATGCNHCGFRGYQGRLPLIELLDINADLREAIARGETDEALRRIATAAGALHTLEADALWHVLEGRTTYEQVQPFLQAEALSAEITRVAEPPVAATRPAPSRPRVLVAVADPVWQAVLEGALTKCDVVTAVVTNGAAALAAIAQQEPAILIVASDLPGLNGEQVMRGARTVVNAMNVRMIALLPMVDEKLHAAAVAAGADDVMAPPIDGLRVRAYIDAALARRNLWSKTADVMRPPIPLHEHERLKALQETGLLDTPPEDRFDRFTREIIDRFGVAMSVISLVDKDRQWFKSRQNMARQQTARDVAFCAHAINYDDVFVVEDAYLDARFSQNPLVTDDPNVRFYAGCPITTQEGHKIGMLCVLDHKPRGFTEEEKQQLRDMTRNLEREIGC